jgi:hypothetical protein
MIFLGIPSCRYEVILLIIVRAVSVVNSSTVVKRKKPFKPIISG